MQEAARRNFRAATLLASPMEPPNDPPLLPVTQSNLSIATAPHDNIQLERFEDVARDRNKLVSAHNDFRKRVQNAECNFSCAQEEKKALVEKKCSWSNYPGAPRKEPKSQNLTQRASNVTSWEETEKLRGLILELRRKFRWICVNCYEHDSEIIFKEDVWARFF